MSPAAPADLVAAALGRAGDRARGWARDLVEFAWPQRCPACGAPAAPERLLCDRCLARIPVIGRALCSACLLADRDPTGCRRHPECVVWPAWVYEERVARVVHALKFESRPALARPLGERIAAAVPPRPRVDLVAGVPLHAARRRERGYDQAARLAEAVADALGAPFAPEALARVRPTAAQARLGPAARRRNLAGAFAAIHPRRLEGRRVLLVDDVVTTGATLAEAARTLARAGAEPVAAALAWAA